MAQTTRQQAVEGARAALLLVLLAALALQPFLALRKTYLFKDIGSDSLTHVYPMLVHLSDYLRSDGFPRWSFRQGMGQNLIGRDLGDPFNWLLAALPRNAIAPALAYVEALKMVLAGLCFRAFLRRAGMGAYAALVGALGYAFCGYVVLGGPFGVLGTETLYLAFLLLAWERLWQEGRWRMWAVAVALLAALQPLDLWVCGWFFLACLSARRLSTPAARPSSAALARILGGTLTGLAMSAVIMLPSLRQMLQSPRVGGSASLFRGLVTEPLVALADPHVLWTALLRLFANDMAGTGDAFRGWQNYFEAPLFYCGLPMLLLVPLFFLHAPRRARYAALGPALFVLLPVLFPFVRHLVWAFTGDYFRTYSLCVVCFLLWFGAQALDGLLRRERAAPFLPLVLALAWLVALLIASRAIPLAHPPALAAIALLPVYALLLAALEQPRLRRAAQRLLLLVFCGELVGMARLTLDLRPVMTGPELRQRAGYQDASLDALAFIEARASGFYRVHKTFSSAPVYHVSLNDSKVQRFRGTLSYHSFNPPAYIGFLAEMDQLDPHDEIQTRWAVGLANAPLLLTWASTRYVLHREFTGPPAPDTIRWEDYGYVPQALFDDVRVLENRFFLPFGFTSEAWLPYAEFHRLDYPRKEAALFAAAVLADPPETCVAGLNRVRADALRPIGNSADLAARVRALGADALVITNLSENLVRGTVAPARKKVMIFTTPFDEGWRARVDGQAAPLLRADAGCIGLVIEPGRHEIELSFHPPLLRAGFAVSLAGVVVWLALGRLPRRARPD